MMCVIEVGKGTRHTLKRVPEMQEGHPANNTQMERLAILSVANLFYVKILEINLYIFILLKSSDILHYFWVFWYISAMTENV